MPAVIAVLPQRIEGLDRMVFGVCAGQHRLVAGEAGDPFLVQLLVGDDIVGQANMLQPSQEMGVRLKVPKARSAAGPHEGQIAAAQVEHRPPAGDVADAAAVAVEVIGRETELRILGRVPG